uniref:THAP domain-containing protein 1 n=1 Tax=Sander lucioperca TaxID=283035 RepID=A0A8D0D4G2_SANLU
MAEETETNRSRGGSYCISPGCSNELYRAKAAGVTIHFHKLPLTRKPVLNSWLAALKLASPPAAPRFRVCNEHFLVTDYLESCNFDSTGSLVRVKSNRLKPEAIPSMIDFSVRHYRPVPHAIKITHFHVYLICCTVAYIPSQVLPCQ